MPLEAKALRRVLSLRRDRRGGLDVRLGHLGDREVVVWVTGMGTALARANTTRLLDALDIDRVVVVGITGGVDDETPIGSLVRPLEVVDAATGAVFHPAALGSAVAAGVMWTTDAITAPESLAELRGRGVVSLDMETAAIAAVCEERGVSWSVVRAVSDGPADEIDDEVFAMARADGRADPGRVVRYLVRHPLRLRRLAAMGRHAQLAAARAAEAAAGAAREL